MKKSATRDQLISNAITAHGAVAVHSASLRALEGDYTPLRALDYDAQTLGDAYAAMALAFERMSPGARTLDKMHAQHAENLMARQAGYSRANEAKRIKSGARRLPGGVLPADAVAALDKLRAAGYAESSVGCIARALVAALNNA